MDSWQEFFNMGGYGAYVWSSYAITFVVLLANAVSPIWCERKIFKNLAQKQRRMKSDDN